MTIIIKFTSLYSSYLAKSLEDISPFSGATNTPVLLHYEIVQSLVKKLNIFAKSAQYLG